MVVGSDGGWLQWSSALSVATASLHCKSDLVHGIGWLSVAARWQRLRPVGKRNLLHVFFDLAMSGLPLFFVLFGGSRDLSRTHACW
jgi:hypothetical protein